MASRFNSSAITTKLRPLDPSRAALKPAFKPAITSSMPIVLRVAIVLSRASSIARRSAVALSTPSLDDSQTRSRSVAVDKRVLKTVRNVSDPSPALP